MVKNKRCGFMLLELLIGMLLTSLMVLAINKAYSAGSVLTEFSVLADSTQSLTVAQGILFEDIKSAHEITAQGRTTLRIYQDEKMVIYRIDGGELIRDDELLCKNTTGSFDIVNNTVEIRLSVHGFNINLDVQGGARR